jgi:putative transcriptional regulator
MLENQIRQAYEEVLSKILELEGGHMSHIISTEKCRECGGVMEGRKGEYKYTECGLNSVTLKDILVFHCINCNDIVPEIPAAGVLHRVIAIKLLLKKTLLTGNELRFLRKFMGYSIDEFCEVTGTNKDVVKGWEKNHSHGKGSDRTVRLLVLNRLLREIAGEPQPILRNVTIQELSEQVEENFKLIRNSQPGDHEEKYNISPKDLEHYGGYKESTDAPVAAAAVN